MTNQVKNPQLLLSSAGSSTAASQACFVYHVRYSVSLSSPLPSFSRLYPSQTSAAPSFLSCLSGVLSLPFLSSSRLTPSSFSSRRVFFFSPGRYSSRLSHSPSVPSKSGLHLKSTTVRCARSWYLVVP